MEFMASFCRRENVTQTPKTKKKEDKDRIDGNNVLTLVSGFKLQC